MPLQELAEALELGLDLQCFAVDMYSQQCGCNTLKSNGTGVVQV
jgi:hypothetical protein